MTTDEDTKLPVWELNKDGSYRLEGFTASVTPVTKAGAVTLHTEGVDDEQALHLLVCQLFDNMEIETVALQKREGLTGLSKHFDEGGGDFVVVRRQSIQRFPARIALGLSGGGLRAVGFHLGVLRGLHELGLLSQVRLASGVSGGSLLLGHVVAAMCVGLNFDDCEARALAFIREKPWADDEGKVAEDSKEAEEPDVYPGSDKTPILRAAAYYNATLPGKRTLSLGKVQKSLVTETTKADGPWGLEEAIFNATELGYARSFVFAVSAASAETGGASGPKSGTKGAWLESEWLNAVSLGHAMAASSAFPLAFAPIRFPDDFYEKSPLPEEWTKETRLPISLIDGGVHDNQGIHAMLNAIRRKGESLDLLLTADADSGTETPHLNGSIPMWVRYSTVVLVALVTVVLAVLALLIGEGATAIVPILLEKAGGFWALRLALLTVSLVVVLVSFFVANGLMKWFARRQLPAAIVAGRWQLIPGVLLRGRVLKNMLMNTFMIRSRRLHYELLFRLAGTSKARRIDALAVQITTLTRHVADRPARQSKSQPDYSSWKTWSMSKALEKVVVTARRVPTTLRLGRTEDERNDRTDDLHSAGQAALAFKIWKWVEQARKTAAEQDQLLDPRLDSLGHSALALLKALDANPLVNSRLTLPNAHQVDSTATRT